MLTRSHQVCSIAIVQGELLVTHQLFVHPLPSLVMLLATGIGATLPDIDQHNSDANHHLLVNLSFLFAHRGITHSLCGWLIFSALSYLILNSIAPLIPGPTLHQWCWFFFWLGLISGYILHVLEDSFSEYGVRWLAPFSHHRYHSALIFSYRVGGPFEKLLLMIAFLAIIMMSIDWATQLSTYNGVF
ncbi:metal-dependent hydrolase [Limosilactobacillus sp.]|uniref:metal-dependent hydrolase n=1 Tax=Limosilactobacillus sp. TaxID=2773925 RepID=UPI00359F4556